MIWGLLFFCFLAHFWFGSTWPFFAFPTTGLLFPFGKSLKPREQLGLPSLKISLNASMLALHHIAIPSSTWQNASSAQHPQPLVNVPAHLQGKQEAERQCLGHKRQERLIIMGVFGKLPGSEESVPPPSSCITSIAPFVSKPTWRATILNSRLGRSIKRK